MKKMLSILAATVLMVGVMSVTVFAHGRYGSGQRAAAQPRNTVCPVVGCEETGAHRHEGTRHCGQGAGSGDYAVCTVENCTEPSLHEHDGTYYYCRNYDTESGCGGNRNR